MDRLGVLTGPYTLKSMKPCDLSCCTRKDILEYFENSYSINESIFTSLKEEKVFYVCPDRLRLPLIFYYAHTATVYINKLMLSGLISERVDMDFETLFETGVDEMSWDDTENYRMGGSFKWPSLKDVVAYRLKVRNVIREVIEETPLELPITMNSQWWAVLMGIDHERIHIETSSVLIRQLPIDMVGVPTDWKNAPRKHGMGAGKNTYQTTEATEVVVGKPTDFPSYGWDNEYPETRIKVAAFKATKYLVTNQEFLEFVEDGGYEKKQFWTEEGWKWRCFRNAKHPMFWVCISGCKSGCGGNLAEYSHCKSPVISNGQGNGHMNDHSITNGNVNGHCNAHNMLNNNNSYGYRTMAEVIDLPSDWPVVVNYLEAKAYCAWKGPEFRLPSEAEHHVMRGTELSVDTGVSCDPLFQDGFKKKYNSNLNYNSSSPVNMFPASDTGFHDTFGNVWEWSEDEFNGLPGSQTHAYYDDFSSPTYDGFHNIILGGSWVSSGQQASRFSRFSFRRHFFQHAGFRLVCNINDDDIPSVCLVETNSNKNTISLPVYHQSMVSPTTNKQILNDTTDTLNTMLHKQYGADVDNYYGNLAELVDEAVEHNINKHQSALVIGCATGRLAFHLAQSFSNVIGIDYSGLFIKAAISLQKTGTLEFPENRSCDVSNEKKKKIENSWSKRKVIIPDEIHRSIVVFKEMTWVPNELRDFNLVIVDFLDRVMNIEAWLLRLWEIIVPKGVVVITSPSEWDADKLSTIIGKRLQCIDSSIIQEKNVQVVKNITIWKHQK